MYLQPKVRNDAQGAGEWRTRRGSRLHKGVDFQAIKGSIVKSHVAGKITKLGYPYGDDLSYRYVEITDFAGLRHRFFYVEPFGFEGALIESGSTIGWVQDIAARYPENDNRGAMQNHIHYEVLDKAGQDYDPWKFLQHFTRQDVIG